MILSVSYSSKCVYSITWALSCKDLARSLRGCAVVSALLFATSGFALSAGFARLLGMLICLSPAESAIASLDTCQEHPITINLVSRHAQNSVRLDLDTKLYKFCFQDQVSG